MSTNLALPPSMLAVDLMPPPFVIQTSASKVFLTFVYFSKPEEYFDEIPNEANQPIPGLSKSQNRETEFSVDVNLKVSSK